MEWNGREGKERDLMKRKEKQRIKYDNKDTKIQK